MGRERRGRMRRRWCTLGRRSPGTGNTSAVAWALWFIFFRAGADASQDVINLDKHHIPDAPTKEGPR